jgi:ankyrin repeat protein
MASASTPPPGEGAAPLAPTLADVADIALFCGYVQEGKQLPFLTSSLYNDRSVFLVTHATTYGPKKRTRLHYLVKKGDVDKLRSVVESAHGGLDIDVCDRSKLTPLHYACMNRDPVTVLALSTLLLERGADPTRTSTLKTTALHMAASGNHEGAVRLLLADGRVDLEARDASGNTALHTAVKVSTSRTIPGLLLDAGASVNARGSSDETPLGMALGRGLTELIDLFLERWGQL